MARGSDLLTVMKTKASKEPVFYQDGKPLTEPGHYRDGKGLYLQVSVWGTKSWVFRYTVRGKTRGMGLGSIEDLTLAQARNEVERLPNCASHGLRKACARRLAEAGCTIHQIKAITGHKTDAEVHRYTAKADQVRLAHSAFEKLQDTADNPKPANPL